MKFPSTDLLFVCLFVLCLFVYVLLYTVPGTPLSRNMFRIAHMATPAPRCSCCYAQRKSRGPEGHGDGNYSSTTDDLTIPYQVGRFYLVLHCDTADDVLVVFIKNIPYTNII